MDGARERKEGLSEWRKEGLSERIEEQGRSEGSEGGMILCDGNYGMYLVHSRPREPERSQVTI